MTAVLELLNQANVLLKKVRLSLGRFGCLELAEKGDCRFVTGDGGRLNNGKECREECTRIGKNKEE